MRAKTDSPPYFFLNKMEIKSGSPQGLSQSSPPNESPGKLQGPKKESRDARVDMVAKLYEKQFLREMVKAMRGTTQLSDLEKPSMGEQIYREQLDQEYVEAWGEHGGIGLADVIYNSLMDRFYPKSRSATQPRISALGKPSMPDGISGKVSVSYPATKSPSPVQNQPQGPDQLQPKASLKAQEPVGGSTQVEGAVQVVRSSSAQETILATNATSSPTNSPTGSPTGSTTNSPTGQPTESSPSNAASRSASLGAINTIGRADIGPTALANLKIDMNPSTGPAKVQAPWSGTVRDISQAQGRVSLLLDHAGGFSSSFQFEGVASADIKPGETLTQGQSLGVLDPQIRSYFWKLQQNSSPSSGAL
jgi:Rod binding domain-containing protein